MATLAMAASLDADLALLEKHAVPTRDLIAFYRKRLAASEAEREDAMQRVVDIEVRARRTHTRTRTRTRARVRAHATSPLPAAHAPRPPPAHPARRRKSRT